jgi:hypothetical protein
MDHPERNLVDRIFRGAPLDPPDWDRLFGHLRGGCASCSAYYSERRGAASGSGADVVLTAAESNALARVLTKRMAAERRRSRLSWRWPALASAVGVAGAALLLWPSGGETPDETQTRGQDGSPTGLKVACLPASGPSARGVPADVSAAGCPPGAGLAIDTLAAATVGARSVTVALVASDLRLLDLLSDDARPDSVVSFKATVAEGASGALDLRLFVLWSAGRLERASIEDALARARAQAPNAAALTSLDVSGVLAQRSLMIPVRRGNAN